MYVCMYVGVLTRLLSGPPIHFTNLRDDRDGPSRSNTARGQRKPAGNGICEPRQPQVPFPNDVNDVGRRPRRLGACRFCSVAAKAC